MRTFLAHITNANVSCFAREFKDFYWIKLIQLDSFILLTTITSIFLTHLPCLAFIKISIMY